MITANKELIILNTSQLFSTYGGSVTFRLMTDVTGIYDMITVNKLTQVDNIGEELENIKSSITQTNNKWTAEFTLSNTSNLLFDGDFNLPTINYWNELNSDASMSLGTVNAYPFYENHQSLLTTFKYNNETGINYNLDLSLEPNTDYVYQAYIHTNNANLNTSDSLPLTYWTWVGDTPTSSETLDTSEIIDYSQIIEVGRYNLCYIHFKTKDLNSSIKCRLFIKGKTNKNNGNNARLSIRQVCFRQRSIPGRFEPNANEVKAGITTIDMNGISVEHTEANTLTQMTANGFFIVDSNGERIAELSSKEQWSQLKADYVFASNIENVYTGEPNLYVDHSATVAGDGTSSKPFNSFAQLSRHLMANPIINKDIYVVVRDPGFAINEQLYLERLKGTGFIKIILEGTLVINNAGNGQYCIRLHQIPKWVWIVSGREFGSSTTGAVLGDGSSEGGGGHGICATDVDRLEVDALTITCKNRGILTERTHLYTRHVDFGKCYCAVELQYMSIYYSSDDVGSCVDFCRLLSGSFAYWGCGTVRPQGNIQKSDGMYYDGGVSLTPTGSPRFGSVDPTPPPTSGQIFTYTYGCTSKQTYQYSWSSWSTDGSCKQGAWGHGLRGGHMFFDISAIRSEMTGTIQDGNTITLTRANNGGISGDANVYINGSSCSSASGTPSYSNQTHLGTLNWGETKTFTLPKAIVQNLVNGTCSSLAVYVNSTANNNYINITSASITLKTKK